MLKSKIVVFFVLVLVAAVLAVGALLNFNTMFVGDNLSLNDPNLEEDRLLIAASFYPLAEFATQVGGDRVEVFNLTPTGIEPHDFEPSPRDLAALYDAQALIYNGAGFEPWVERVAGDLEAAGLTLIDASEGIELIKATGGHSHSNSNDHDNDYDNEHDNDYDPHVWLDPTLAAQQIENILAYLVAVDPDHDQYYRQNAQNYQEALLQLDEDFATGLVNCVKHEVVTSHNAFQYMADRYGFEVKSIAGLSPDEEPSPRRLAEIADFVRDHEVNYIFFETLVSPRLAETIALETGAQTLVFNPIEGLTEEGLELGRDYLSIQRDNLFALQKALECR